MDAKTFITNYKNVIIAAIVAIGIFGFLISKIIPTVGNISKIKNDYASAQNSVTDKERVLKELQEKAEQTEEE